MRGGGGMTLQAFTRKQDLVTLLYFDGPVAFLAKNDKGTPHLFVLADDHDETECWAAVPTSPERAEQLIHDQVSLSVIWKESSGPAWVIVRALALRLLREE